MSTVPQTPPTEMTPADIVDGLTTALGRMLDARREITAAHEATGNGATHIGRTLRAENAVARAARDLVELDDAHGIGALLREQFGEVCRLVERGAFPAAIARVAYLAERDRTRRPEPPWRRVTHDDADALPDGTRLVRLDHDGDRPAVADARSVLELPDPWLPEGRYIAWPPPEPEPGAAQEPVKVGDQIADDHDAARRCIPGTQLAGLCGRAGVVHTLPGGDVVTSWSPYPSGRVWPARVVTVPEEVPF